MHRMRSCGSPSRPCVQPLEKRYLLATLAPNFSEASWGGSITNGTAMEFAPDGRLFVLTQTGTVHVISPTGVLNPTPALSLTVDSFFERGLLGIAFDPSFDAAAPGDDYVYLYYTDLNGANPSFNKISRFTVTGNTINAGSETTIFSFNLLSAGNHNGGAIHFGADGMLYAAHGENAVSSNSQTVANLLGKVIRIDPDAFVPGNPESVIPADNPTQFTVRQGGVDVVVNPTGINRAIFAVGLRNPYTFAFQPGTGRLHINDVGASSFEEVNLGAAGANYGWPNTEGDFTQASFPNFTRPLHAYGRSTGTTISGGAFYNPAVQLFPESFNGDYFFGDYGSDWIRRLDAGNGYALQSTGGVSNGANFASGATDVVDQKIGPDGALYYLQRGSPGGVRRVAPNSPQVTNSTFVSDGILLPAPPHELRFTFNESVAASLTTADLLLENLTDSTTVPTGNISLSYNGGTNVATFTFPGYTDAILPDGVYRATLEALGVTDADGAPLTADYVVEFHVLAGDATGDRKVDLDDFNILATSFGTSGQTFNDGDFDYDGDVDLDDFNLLAGNFGTDLTAPAASKSRGALSLPARGASRMAAPLTSPVRFSDALIGSGLSAVDSVLVG